MATARAAESGRRRVAVGVGIAVALLALLLFALDPRAIGAALADADPTAVGLAAVASLFAQLCWSLTTASLLSGIDDTLPRTRVQLGYLAGTFGKQVLPLGNVGGSAILAYVIADDLDRRFRDVFAAVTASELLVFAGSLGAAALGLVSLLVRPVPGFDGPVVPGLAALLVGLLLVGSAVAAYRRAAIGAAIVRIAGLLRWSIGRVSTRVHRALDPNRVRGGVDAFFASFEAATGDERRVAVAATFGLVGWLSFSLALYYAFSAVGVAVPVGLVLFLAPASGIATLVPTPGGLGGSEVGLTAVFALVTAASPAVAAAGVIVFRLATYWLVLAVGGLSSLYLSTTVWHALD